MAFFDIEPVNDAPILQGKRIAGAVEDNSFAFAMTNLLANDSDVDGDGVLEFVGLGAASHGQVWMTAV